MFGKKPIAPPPENLNIVGDKNRVVLDWDKLEGNFDGYIVFAGTNEQEMQGIERIEDKGVTKYVVHDPVPREIYAVATYKGPRISKLVFAALETEKVPAETVETAQPETRPGTIESEQTVETLQEAPPQEEKKNLCIFCEGELSWQEVKEGDRKRDVLKCGKCEKEHLLSANGRIFSIERLEYGSCKCPECSKKQILIIRGDKAVCSKTGKEHAVYKRGGKITKITLATEVEFGFCKCCIPHQPLVFKNGKFSCHAKPDVKYRRIGASNDFERCVPGERRYGTGTGDDPRRHLLEGDLSLGGGGLPV